jgi:hypothetical protein
MRLIKEFPEKRAILDVLQMCNKDALIELSDNLPIGDGQDREIALAEAKHDAKSFACNIYEVSFVDITLFIPAKSGKDAYRQVNRIARVPCGY